VNSGEYGIVLNFRDDPANPNNKQVQCPICGKWYGQYLIMLVPRGLIACNRCMGSGAQALITSIIQRGAKILIDSVQREVDLQLARLIGWSK